MVIKIFGGKSEGKTTLAKFLEKVLREQGIEVENHDEGDSVRFVENMDIIKSAGQQGDPLKVEIKTILYQRETLPKFAKDFNQSKIQKKD